MNALILCLGFFLTPQAGKTESERLVEQLGSANIADRDKAYEELERLGEKVIPELQKALKKESSEIRARAHKLLWKATEIPRATKAAVIWLARNQEADGSWKASFEDYTWGLTGLVLVALHEAGYSSESKEDVGGNPAGQVVRKGLRFLLEGQDSNGCLAPRRAAKYVLSHAVATLALSEAYRVTRQASLKSPLTKAVDYLLSCQNKGKGWRYSWRCGDNDTNVTTWALLALMSAKAGSLSVPQASLDGAAAWYQEVTDNEGRAGYTVKGGTRVLVDPTPADHHRGSLTAMGIVGRAVLGADTTKGETHVLAQVPRWERDEIIFGYWFWGSLAVHRAPRASSNSQKWDRAIRETLIPNQSEDGSWVLPDSVASYEHQAGRTYSTSMALLAIKARSTLSHLFEKKRKNR